MTTSMGTTTTTTTSRDPPADRRDSRGRHLIDSTFDPDDLNDGGGIFGLPRDIGKTAVQLIPVPWQGTVSFGAGTGDAPQAILRASRQVDLHHPIYVDAIWTAGVVMESPASELLDLVGGLDQAERGPGSVDPVSVGVDRLVGERVAAAYESGRIPGIVGGEHSVALGGLIEASARHPGLGVLQIDAHADLRVDFQGFARSHASVMHNALELAPGLAHVVQVGVRDVGRSECARIGSEPRITAFFDDDLAARKLRGACWADLVDELLEPLPGAVWVSFDVDGLDPSLCPGTGTPVPGGLSWHEACLVLRKLAHSGRRVIGFDLCEVGADPWDANVGARLLYELSGCAVATRA